MSSCFWLALLHLIKKRNARHILLIGFLLCLSVVFSAVLAIFQEQIIAVFAEIKHEKVVINSGFLSCTKIGIGETFTKRRQPYKLQNVDATVYQRNCDNVILDFSLDEPKRTIVLERTELLIQRANSKEGSPAYRLCSSEQSTWQKDLYRPPSENNTYLSKATFSLDCSLRWPGFEMKKYSHESKTISIWIFTIYVKKSIALAIKPVKEKIMKFCIEIRPAEGGDDSKQFVTELAHAYTRFLGQLGWLEPHLSSPGGSITLIATADTEIFRKLQKFETGGHRIQRVPFNERQGRVHTSTCTVAVIEFQPQVDVQIPKYEIEVQWFSGTGAGGQHRNKHANSARLRHIPTGIVTTAQCRSRENSFSQAYDELHRLVCAWKSRASHESVALDRKAMVGTGMRGDKIRTYRFQDDRVKDDRTGLSAPCSKVMKGGFDLLWPCT